jgi:hypothetical protein
MKGPEVFILWTGPRTATKPHQTLRSVWLISPVDVADLEMTVMPSVTDVDSALVKHGDKKRGDVIGLVKSATEAFLCSNVPCPHRHDCDPMEW